MSAFTTVPRLRDAIFDPFVAVPFWLGVGWMCWRWRDPRHLVVLAWAIGILVIGGMMTDYPPSKARMLGLLPAVCVIPAVVAGQLRAQLARLLPRRGDYLVVPLLLVWLASAAEFNWRSEFVMRPAEQRGLDPMTELYRAVTRTSLPATFYLARGADLPTVAQALRDCMAPRNPDRHVVELPVDASVVPIPPSNVGNAVLLIAGPAEDLAPLVEHYYPDATHEIIRDPNWGSVVLHIFRLPSAALDRHRGLQGIGDAADPRGGTTRLEPPEDAPLPVTATWAGLIWLPETAHYAFRADPGRVRVDTTWFSDNAPARELTAGWHEIEVQVTFTSRAAPAVLSWKRPGSAAWRDVPREFLNTHPALHGLLGRYYGSDQPDRGPRPLDAPPDNQHIETALSFDWQPGSDDPAPGYFAARPSTMEWLGTVELAEGEPVLRLEATTPTQVFVDGALVASTLGGRTAPPVEVHLAGVRGPATLLVRTRRSADDNWFFWKLKLLWKQPGGTWSAFARYAPPGAPRSPDGS